MVAAGRDEGGAGPAGGQRETQHAAIEIERPLQIGDLQVHMPDAHAGVDGGHPQGFFLDLDGLGHGAVLGGYSWLAGRAFDTHMYDARAVG